MSIIEAQNQTKKHTMTNETTTTNNARPSFLTVLCILTFIGSGLGLLGGLLGLVGVGFLSKMLPGAAAGGMTIASIIGIIASAGKLFGAMQMWKLKLQGLWIYIGCELLALVGTIVSSMKSSEVVSSVMDKSAELAGNSGDAQMEAAQESARKTLEAASTAGNTMAIASGVLFSALFIALYFMNKKHLK